MVYQLIESYGVIGDLHTVALVGMEPQFGRHLKSLNRSRLFAAPRASAK